MGKLSVVICAIAALCAYRVRAVEQLNQDQRQRLIRAEQLPSIPCCKEKEAQAKKEEQQLKDAEKKEKKECDKEKCAQKKEQQEEKREEKKEKQEEKREERKEEAKEKKDAAKTGAATSSSAANPNAAPVAALAKSAEDAKEAADKEK